MAVDEADRVSFSTLACAKPLQAFELWADQVRRNVSRLDLSSDRPHEFRGDFVVTKLGPLSLTSINATQQNASFQPGPGYGLGQYDLVCMRGGEMTIDQGGESLKVGSGDILLVSKLHGFRFRTPGESACAMISVPCDWLRAWLPDPEACIMRPIRSGAAWSGLLPQLVQDAEAASTSGRTFSRGLLMDQIGGSIGLMFGDVSSLGSSYRRGLRRELMRTMRAHFFESNLSPRQVADHHRISLRYLHSIFSSAGTTFGAELRNIRLTRFREMLVEPAFAKQQISELALSCGYRDPAYLSRVFRDIFGQTPTEFRGRAEAAGAPDVSGTS